MQAGMPFSPRGRGVHQQTDFPDNRRRLDRSVRLARQLPLPPVELIAHTEGKMRARHLITMGLLTLLAVPALADKGVAMRSGCMGCHQPDKATVGPAIRDIAAKFGPDADIDTLVAIVKNGKKPDQLTWGKIPMPPSPAPENDVRTVINWMLSQQ
jgi:cytochrome c